jgi:hypothetical protein
LIDIRRISWPDPITLALNSIQECLLESGINSDKIGRLIEILFWFGFLGIKVEKKGETFQTYIYDVYYDMKKIKRLCKNFQDSDLVVTIHCAFWPFLEIESSRNPY